MAVKSKVLITENGLKVVRLSLSQGDKIPEHSTNAHVVVTTLSGEGIFTIKGQANEIKQGDVFDMKPNDLHAISTDHSLELIVVHAKLINSSSEEVQCGSVKPCSTEESASNKK